MAELGVLLINTHLIEQGEEIFVNYGLEYQGMENFQCQLAGIAERLTENVLCVVPSISNRLARFISK